MRKTLLITCFSFLTLFTFYQTVLPRMLFLKTDSLASSESTILEQDLSLVQEILKKPLKFTGINLQNFVVAAENDDYVVQISKTSRYKTLFTGKPKRDREIDFASYFLAAELLPEQSQVVFAHFKTTNNLKTSIKVVDPLGIPHFLNADNLTFFIQKKAIPLTSYLKTLPASEAAPFIHKLFDLLLFSCNQGLQIRDIQPKNIGVHQGSPMWTDVSRIRQKPTLREVRVQKRVLRRFGNYLRRTVIAFNPELKPILQQELEQALSNL